MKGILLPVLVLATIAFFPFTANADTYYVPEDFSTIQAGLSGAVNGDVIIVRDGTWTGSGNKNLDFGGKAITLISENGPNNCTIDCGGDGRGFNFHNGETSNSVVDGFTITNATISYLDGWGAGIFCDSSSPTIKNCTISNGIAFNGAGISCWYSSPTINNCSFVGNSASYEGGAIHCSQSSPSISHCIIDNNSSVRDGGGIHCTNYSSPTIFNCAITNCTSDEDGGGIYCWYSSPIISLCTISGNTAAVDGGGVACYFSYPTISDSILWYNSASFGSELSLRFTSSVYATHSNIGSGPTSIQADPDCYLNPGPGIIRANPLFAAGPLDTYYLSQILAGQASNSPCVDSGSDTSANLGLDSLTTRTDQVVDSGVVDMGYHHQVITITSLTRINLAAPANESVLYSAPTFSWTPDGGMDNVFAVDVSLSPTGPFYSTWETLRTPISQTSWTMPTSIWNRIPSGSYVYWKVRGADLYSTTPAIVYCDELWWFYKP